MSTVAEIVEAVKQLPLTKRRELLDQLEPVLLGPALAHEQDQTAEHLSPEFTARMIEHFHRAKRAALGRS